MATILTETGWEKDGNSLGTWTNQSDVVEDLEDGILLNTDVTANTKAGDDSLTGKVDDTNSAGIFIQGTLDTSSGKDTISGNAQLPNDITFRTNSKGLSNEGTIDTGAADDSIIGETQGG